MISLEDIREFLPKFLSQGSETAFLDEIKQFLSAGARPFYTSALAGQPILFQGDGIEGMLVINLPDSRIAPAPAMLFSNTCDASPDNQRLYSAVLSYAPIFSLERYLTSLRGKYPQERIDAHERDIRAQIITQIFFLPKGGNLQGDSLVFLDRTMSASIETVGRDQLLARRLYTLSDFGAWFFALKLSIHFCRFRDKVDRTAGVII